MSGDANSKDTKQSSLATTTTRNELKLQRIKEIGTLLSSASSPSIADSLSKKDEKKTDAPKGMINSSSATSIVSNWILAPFERLNHTTADFEIYAGSPPEDSSEGTHYFGGGGYIHEQQNQARESSMGKNPKSEIISKLMPHVVASQAAQKQSLSVKPSFDNLSQFFDASSNEPSPNVSPMASPRNSPFLGRRLISPDGTVASISRYPVNSDTPSTDNVGSNDKKSKSPQTFKFNVANFDLNAVGPSSW